ncbi:MAG: hypothetical protein HZB91_05305 [Elusimicrobia bacterium]|nr:hypothetical protein [Elusimicrobiota bacterium]
MNLVKIDWNPDRKALRWFAGGMVVFAVLIGAFAFWKDRSALKAVAGILAAAGCLAWALPDIVGRTVYKAWMGAAFVISMVVSNVVIILIFYGLITPLGLLLRALGRDSLRLKRGAGSHWVPVTMPADTDQYERLF